MNDSNDTTPEEFTHWKATTAFFLTSELFIILPVSLFINTSILVTISRTKLLRKPLNLIHQSLLLLNCLVIIADAITACIIAPRAIRFCECSLPASSTYFVISLLYIVFQPLNYACLAVFQLLTIKGKKRLVSFKMVSAAMFLCIGVTTFLAVGGLTIVNLAGQTYICNSVCPLHLSAKFPAIGIALASYIIVSWFPSFLVVMVCTSWSCLIFKKSYIGGNDDLNKRIISLPIVLPITLAIPSILSASFLGVLEQTLQTLEVADSVYWIVFARLISFQVHAVISGIAYPCILLCLNPKIGHTWKEQLRVCSKCQKSNKVAPSTCDATQTSQLSNIPS